MESREHLSNFFQDSMSKLYQPDFVYGAIMAISFVAACLLLVSVIMLLVKLYQVKVQKRQRDTIDVSQLKIPTLGHESASRPFEMMHVPKVDYHSRDADETAQVISEHVRNIVQPNRKQINA